MDFGGGEWDHVGDGPHEYVGICAWGAVVVVEGGLEGRGGKGGVSCCSREEGNLFGFFWCHCEILPE